MLGDSFGHLVRMLSQRALAALHNRVEIALGDFNLGVFVDTQLDVLIAHVLRGRSFGRVGLVEILRGEFAGPAHFDQLADLHGVADHVFEVAVYSACKAKLLTQR
jgi:hypothetical protein